jgi:5-aminolevulinate synthase
VKTEKEEVTPDQQNLEGASHSQNSFFGYDNFFQQQILKKKKDHSYRIFKKVARFANQPPLAHNYAESGKDVTVWCSNDYLGMTAHPKVRGAVQ